MAIQYTLSGEVDVRLVIYNILGQEIRTLVNAAQASGVYTVAWNGQDAFGRQVSTGVYLYRLQAGQNIAVKKMVFTK